MGLFGFPTVLTDTRGKLLTPGLYIHHARALPIYLTNLKPRSVTTLSYRLPCLQSLFTRKRVLRSIHTFVCKSGMRIRQDCHLPILQNSTHQMYSVSYGIVNSSLLSFSPPSPQFVQVAQRFAVAAAKVAWWYWTKRPGRARNQTVTLPPKAYSQPPRQNGRTV